MDYDIKAERSGWPSRHLHGVGHNTAAPLQATQVVDWSEFDETLFRSGENIMCLCR